MKAHGSCYWCQPTVEPVGVLDIMAVGALVSCRALLAEGAHGLDLRELPRAHFPFSKVVLELWLKDQKTFNFVVITLSHFD